MLGNNKSQLMGAAAMAAALIPYSSACSTFVVNPWNSDTANGPNTVSGRTMDFDTLDLNGTISIVPKGSVLQPNLLPIDYEGLSFNVSDNGYYTAKYGFVAAMVNLQVSTKKISGPADGLNEKGLSCAALYDTSLKEVFVSQAYPEVNASDSQRTKILEVYNLCKYILAKFDTAEAAVTDIDPSTTQVVQTKAVRGLNFFHPLHFIVMDTDRQMWVAEFGNYTNGDSFVWRNATEWGVITNQPQLPGQLENLEKFISSNPDVKEAIEKVNKYESEGTVNGTLPGILSPVPGSTLSADRFVRLALFNRIGSWASMPLATATYMPPESLKETYGNYELLTALQLIGSVTVPRGSAYSSAGDSRSGRPGFDVTQWRMIRDHTNGVLYFTAYSDLTWAKIDVAEALHNRAAVSEKASKVALETYSIPLNAGALGFTAYDALAKF